MIYFIVILLDRSPKGTLENFTLKSDVNWETFRWAFVISALLLAIGLFIHKTFGDRLNKKKKNSKEPLKYEKIVVDDTNLRQGIRVPASQKIIFERAQFPKKQKPLPDFGQIIDVSYRGVAFISTLEFPVETNISFKIMETEVVASSVMMGVVVGSRPWSEQTPEGEVLFFTSLNLKNVGEQARGFLTRMVSEGERELLADEREKRGDN